MFLGTLIGCVAQTKVDSIASSYGFERQIVNSKNFRHLVYRHNIENTSVNSLHVYLEGDGSPWLRPNIISRDPTGRTPLALELMALDKQPSLYLGRPCYHGFYQDANCSVLLWTHARYAKPVVDSMEDALRQIIKQHHVERLLVIGYSGGGVLAMLLAERVPEIKSVITIAANLDIAAWAALHDYSPLQTSLNPALRIDLYQNLAQLHLAGGQDENVPLRIIESFVNKQKPQHVRLQVYDEFDHKCCWSDVWQSIVDKLEHE